MSKGEGSRGGKVIRHTKSGRAVYDDNQKAIRRNAASGAALGVGLLAGREATIGARKAQAFKRARQSAQAAAHLKFSKAALGVTVGAYAGAIGLSVAASVSRNKDNRGKSYWERQNSGANDLNATLGGTAAVVAGGLLGTKLASKIVKGAKKAAPVVKEEFKFRSAKKVVSGSASATGKISGLLGYTKGKK